MVLKSKLYVLSIIVLLAIQQSVSSQEMLAVASIDGKYGFINVTGKWQIRPDFDEVKGFFHGLAAVRHGSMWGYIDSLGNMVIPAKYDYAGSFENSEFAKVNLVEKSYYINRKGNILLEDEDDVVIFHEDLALVKVGHKFGYLNREFKWHIVPQFEMAWPFRNGFAKVKKGGKWFVIDTQGKQYGLQPNHRSIAEKDAGQNQSLKRGFRDSGWGFTDRGGTWRVHPVFDYVKPFSEDYAPVRIGDSWGYIDKESTIVIDVRFEDAHIFNNGLASVSINGKYGCIDKRGKIVIQPKYDSPLFFYKTEKPETTRRSAELARQNLFKSDEINIPDFDRLTADTYIPEDKRLALIIGNSEYNMGGYLPNPVNDAMAMAETLQDLGFVVMIYLNTSQLEMKQAIDRFGQQLGNYDIGLVFYAGHGVQVKGYNYLVPVDAKIISENDVEYSCVDAGRILGLMEDAGNKTNLIILDACRDNPFERSWTRSTQGQGLAFMNAPSGSLIAYATAPGRTASDGSPGSNGLYTSSLLKYIKTPGLTIYEVFQQVRQEVRQVSANQQIPWESTSLEGNFYFRK